jgi:hypothetical protein
MSKKIKINPSGAEFVLHREFAYALPVFITKLNILCCFQKDDLRAVVNYLRTDENVSLIGLWGRSMGAVTRLVFVILLFNGLIKLELVV